MMLIETKYDVGHTFWVPRSRKVFEQEELNYEGETWYRDVEVLEPSAKLKKIVCIDVHVGRVSSTKYGVKNIDDGDKMLTSFYPEENITNYTEEEALAIAKGYAEAGKTYYGN
jgi:hypothetical protein